jgi:hypothetical protein
MRLSKYFGRPSCWPYESECDKVMKVGPYLITCRYRRPKVVQTELAVGVTVRIDSPDNPRLHNQIGIVEKIEDWGAHLRTVAAATGYYRALYEEMKPVMSKPELEVQVEYTGNCCDMCGSLRQLRTGTCVTCQDCGNNSGCA